ESQEEVKITFDKGMLIYAEGTPSRDEARIEYNLLANSLIKMDDWKAIKQEHDDKLKPYWDLLARKLDPKVLLELINRQTVDTVYFALRWVKGTYEFTPVKNLRYNNKVMRPMDVDGILMEGCRIADEWTRVAASIPPFDSFVVKNILGEGEEQEDKSGKKDDEPKDFMQSLEFDVLSARGISLKESHVKVLTVIGSGKTIQEIINSARQGSFITLEALHALLNMGVITATKKKKAMMQVDHSTKGVSMAVTVVLAAVVGLGGLANFSGATAGEEARKQSVAIVKNEAAKNGLKKVERAMKVYMIINSLPPKSVDDLVNSNVLAAADSVDPWENKYMLETGGDNFSIYSTGPDIGLLVDNIYLEP
ncbi:MAG: DUF4388 domain-containing protein, partial [Nitrospinota bacterium]|nr:DUF4388 domain-containing protein [Nitrospinota bacterium]